MDPTDDPVHGSQQLSMFNGHYGAHCYLPMLGFVSFNDEPDQYLVAAMLRPGNAPAQRGAIGLLKRLIPELRLAFPFAWIRVRLDGGFACPELFPFLEEQQVEYLVAMGKNSVLSKRSASALAQAQALFEENGETVYVGGRNVYLKHRIIEKLKDAGFNAQEDTTNHSGQDNGNICNKGVKKEGLQLEISKGLREKMFRELKRNDRKYTTEVFDNFVKSIRFVLCEDNVKEN